MIDTDLNHVTLTGVLERDPITRFADHGTQQAQFYPRLIEVPAGQPFTLFVPVEAYSQVAELGRGSLFRLAQAPSKVLAPAAWNLP